jgi:AcrR family transcriptional regulator
MSPRPGVQADRDHQRQRILEAFEARARPDGPRGVVMAELARDLGISTRTLYQHFGSKAELVQEIMERWAAELEAEQQRRLHSDLSPKLRTLDAAESWIVGQDRFSQAFWSQLQLEFPDASRVLAEQVRKSLLTARDQLAPQLHPDFDLDLALSLLKSSIRHALDPKRCDRLGLSRRDAVHQAVELWCRGALRPRPEPV